MTFDELIAEGRRLQRPCVFLRTEPNGAVAAVWHEPDDAEIEATGYRCWLTVDASQIPGLSPSLKGYVSVFTDEEDCTTGRVEIAPSWPKRGGIELYAHAASVLPPRDAVFARGSQAVGDWIESLGWKRTERYHSGFSGDALTSDYFRIWTEEFPLYFESDIYAMLGGWHWPGQDDDWYDLIDEQLMVLTFRESEPWVEAWRMRSGEFKVIQRIT